MALIGPLHGRWKPLIKRIRNITFAVSSLKETIAFYEHVLGLKKTAEWADYATFDAGGFDLAFEPGGRKGAKAGHAEGMPSVFLEVDDVDEVYRQLKAKGVKFVTEPKDQYWGGRTATLVDPDDYMLVLTRMKE